MNKTNFKYSVKQILNIVRLYVLLKLEQMIKKKPQNY
jgi:hypothetical protein